MAARAAIMSLALVTVAAPVILASFLTRRARKIASEQEISFTDDLQRSFARGLTAILPLPTMRWIFKARPTKYILSSNRFKPFKDQFLIRVSNGSFNGYWICKGPPGKPQLQKESDIVLLWFHGGAYCFGDPLAPALNLLRVAEIAAARGISMSILSVEYTLAPTATFPHQLREAIAAYRYLLHVECVPAEKVILGGESAGGHLALSSLMALKEEILAKPRGAMLLYPWLKLTSSGPTFESNRNKDVLSKRLLDRCGEAAMGERGRVDALNLENLIRHWQPGCEQTWKDILPEYTWVNIGAHDVLLHDVQTFVDCAKADGAQLFLEVVSRQPHYWNYARDRNWEDFYCNLGPNDQVPPGVMEGSTRVAEGLFMIVNRGN
ncbi:Alpha/Beta hydrolase protein [Aspergillus undulatus]|uniref:Alpha/Beta hydrolase protein n=1 Tax=Aspergillus undulatus TaxID=1810928 RepID=UPI003CCD3657